MLKNEIHFAGHTGKWVLMWTCDYQRPFDAVKDYFVLKGLIHQELKHDQLLSIDSNW